MQIIMQLLDGLLISTAPQQHPIVHGTQQPLTRHLQITLLLQQGHEHISIQIPLTLLIIPEYLLDLPTSQSLKNLHDYGNRDRVRTQVLLFHLQEELERVVELLVLTQSVQHNIKVNLVQILLRTLVVTLVYQNGLLILSDLKQPLDVRRIRNHIFVGYPIENGLGHLEIPRLQRALQTGVIRDGIRLHLTALHLLQQLIGLRDVLLLSIGLHQNCLNITVRTRVALQQSLRVLNIPPLNMLVDHPLLIHDFLVVPLIAHDIQGMLLNLPNLPLRKLFLAQLLVESFQQVLTHD